MSKAFELLVRKHRDKAITIGTTKADATLSEELRTLADAVDEALGGGCKRINSWGIGFQFERGGEIFDVQLISRDIELECLYRPPDKRPETETQEARAVRSKRTSQLAKSG